MKAHQDTAKIAKQFQHADKRGIPFVLIAGESEMKENVFGLKNLVTGEQVKLDFEGLKGSLV